MALNSKWIFQFSLRHPTSITPIVTRAVNANFADGIEDRRKNKSIAAMTSVVPIAIEIKPALGTDIVEPSLPRPCFRIATRMHTRENDDLAGIDDVGEQPFARETELREMTPGGE